ncbi:hypothetical protein EVAR_62822_1 [Eumeta japonica]|uniref:Uncharacterized protein n=1 Tax=Eumeta variegata TaxID=151549 RepID=A0A4C2A3F0_EUMVA|nr:hypothetical protein EVAR_62822_1 [Eumeta japonica]
MEEIRPSHKAFWSSPKRSKRRGIHLFPAQKTDGSTALDDAEVAECLADSIETQCSHVSPARPCSYYEVQLLVITQDQKGTGLDGISNKAIKCFPNKLLSLLVAILTRAFKIVTFSRLERGGGMSVLTRPTLNQSRSPSRLRPLSLLYPHTPTTYRARRPASNSRSQMTPRYYRVGIEPPFYHPPPPESH